MKLYKHKYKWHFVLIKDGYVGSLNFTGWKKWCSEKHLNMISFHEEFKQIGADDLPEHIREKLFEQENPYGAGQS